MKFLSLKRIALFAVIVGGLYLCLLNQTPHGDSCVSSTSTDDAYVAELCLLTWSSRDIPEYVGRVYDAKSGKMLAQSTFLTSDPEVIWFKSGGLAFSRGDEAAFIDLPPSKWDRLLAARPRTHDWSVLEQASSKHVIGDWSPFQEHDKHFDINRTLRCWDSRTGKEVSCSSQESPPKQ
ncbi:hypothetical protein AAHK20_31425 [Trinickia sp. YCB016]